LLLDQFANHSDRAVELPGITTDRGWRSGLPRALAEVLPSDRHRQDRKQQ
jgi:hypothetical protein